MTHDCPICRGAGAVNRPIAADTEPLRDESGNILIYVVGHPCYACNQTGRVSRYRLQQLRKRKMYGRVTHMTAKKPFNHRVDWTYSEGCGCRVTFFAASDFHSSRMLPGESCTAHGGRYQVAERDCYVERAKEALAEARGF